MRSTKYFTYLDLLCCRYRVWPTHWVLLKRRVRLDLCLEDIINRPRDYKGIYLVVVGVNGYYSDPFELVSQSSAIRNAAEVQ